MCDFIYGNRACRPDFASHCIAITCISKSGVSFIYELFACHRLCDVFTGFISSRIGAKWTLLLGLIFIIVFSALGGTSSTINELIGFRGGWGIGNALFISTALSVIVGVSVGGSAKAIILYEAALGLGISVGPLLGGELGTISWRGPFFGVAVLMLVALLAIIFMLPPIQKPQKKVKLFEAVGALKYKGLLTMASAAFLYNFGFFVLLAYSPFVLHLDEHGLGYVFWMGIIFGCDICLLSAGHSSQIGYINSSCCSLCFVCCDFIRHWNMDITCGRGHLRYCHCWGILGMINTVLTTAVMGSAPVERSIASSSYSAVRFIGGAIAPWIGSSR